MKLRSLAIGLSLLAAGAIIGVSTQQFASADVSSGERPVLVPIETCRIADTRPAPNTVGPRTSPLGAADTMTIDAQQAGTDCTGKIPAGATALSLNITALDATSNSFLTIWPDGDRPTSSSLNPAPGIRVFNAVTTQLAADQTFKIFNNRGSVNVFVDINGYYENHNHDDRYDTSTEVDSKVSAAISAYDEQPWSIPIAPTEMVNPSNTEFWPAMTFNSGTAASAFGLAFAAGDFGRVWVSFSVPSTYEAGTDLRVDLDWMPIPTGFGVPAVGCTAVVWVNGPSINRVGTKSFTTVITGANPELFSPSESLLEFTTDGMNGVLQTTPMTMTGAQLLPGDRVTFALNRDGDDSRDTCTGGLMVTGITVSEAT